MKEESSSTIYTCWLNHLRESVAASHSLWDLLASTATLEPCDIYESRLKMFPWHSSLLASNTHEPLLAMPATMTCQTNI